jgi:hypothetical protein
LAQLETRVSKDHRVRKVQRARLVKLVLRVLLDRQVTLEHEVTQVSKVSRDHLEPRGNLGQWVRLVNQVNRGRLVQLVKLVARE